MDISKSSSLPLKIDSQPQVLHQLQQGSEADSALPVDISHSGAVAGSHENMFALYPGVWSIRDPETQPVAWESLCAATLLAASHLYCSPKQVPPHPDRDKSIMTHHIPANRCSRDSQMQMLNCTKGRTVTNFRLCFLASKQKLATIFVGVACEALPDCPPCAPKRRRNADLKGPS